MTQTEALRLALEALTDALNKPMWNRVQMEAAITAIKAALVNEALERKAENARELGLDYYVPCCTDKTCPKCKAALEAKDEPVAHSVVAGALFDFMGWLTSREKRLILSSVDEASPAVEAITEFAKKRNLSLKYAEVGYWMEFLSTPPQQEAKDEPWEKFCDSHCVWTDHHPDCKLAEPDQYAKGYADAMNWKAANYLEHLPAAQNLSEWKLVPIEPTEEMLKAMDECSTEGYDERLLAGHAASVYMAAVDVAPTPPQRTWVGLTAEEREQVQAESYGKVPHHVALIAAVEAKLKEKNFKE